MDDLLAAGIGHESALLLSRNVFFKRVCCCCRATAAETIGSGTRVGGDGRVCAFKLHAQVATKKAETAATQLKGLSSKYLALGIITPQAPFVFSFF